jgi:hypothetical protein
MCADSPVQTEEERIPFPAPDGAPSSPKKAKKCPPLFKSPNPVLLDTRDSIKVKKEDLE